MPPLELILPVLGYVVAPALLTAALVFGLSLRLFGVRTANYGAVAGFCAACLVANCVGEPLLPWLPDKLGWQCLLWVATLAMLIGLAARRTIESRLGLALVAVLTAGHAAWILVPTGMQTDPPWASSARALATHLNSEVFERLTNIVAVPVFALVVFIEWEVLQRLAKIRPGGAVPLATALAFLGAATVLIHAHSARMTDIATVCAMALVGLAIVAWPMRTDVGAVMPAAAVMLPGLLLGGYYETYSQVPWLSFALVGIAPLFLLLYLASPLVRLAAPLGTIVLMIILLAPMAVAVGLAMHAEPLQFE